MPDVCWCCDVLAQHFGTFDDCKAALPKLNEHLPAGTPKFTDCVRPLADAESL